MAVCTYAVRCSRKGSRSIDVASYTLHRTAENGPTTAHSQALIRDMPQGARARSVRTFCAALRSLHLTRRPVGRWCRTYRTRRRVARRRGARPHPGAPPRRGSHVPWRRSPCIPSGARSRARGGCTSSARSYSGLRRTVQAEGCAPTKQTRERCNRGTPRWHASPRHRHRHWPGRAPLKCWRRVHSNVGKRPAAARGSADSAAPAQIGVRNSAGIGESRR